VTLFVPSPHPFRRRLSTVLSEFSHKNINYIRVSPLDGVTLGGPPRPSLMAPLRLRQFGTTRRVYRQSPSQSTAQ